MISPNVLLSIGGWNPAYGGPFFSVGNLARALHGQDVSVSLFAGDYPHMPVVSAPEGVSFRTTPGRLLPVLRQTVMHQATKDLERFIGEIEPTIVHDNGMWLSLNHKVARATHRHQIPRMLSPRGTLDPWAMQYRCFKKRIALALYQRRDLEEVSAFHAASYLEAENIRAQGLRQPIVIIPNGVDLSPTKAKFDANAERIALFVGRLHPIKNLPTLLKAWAKVRPSGWRLKLAGSDEVGHCAELRALARSLKVEHLVEFCGPVYGEEKEALFADAELFLLISKSENFGVAAAEALATGLPVIASKSTPWSCLEKEELGWWINDSIDSVAATIESVTKLSSDTLRERGQRGRDYARHQFSWSAIGQRFFNAYSWIAGQGDKPVDVLT
jgi:glycosyltransferase involved in cell wall biosynthesis